MHELHHRTLALCKASIALAALLSGTAALAKDLPTASPEEVGLSSQRLERLDTVLQDSIAQRRISGAVAIVIRHGRVAYHKAFGLSNIEAKRATRTDDMFRLYSMTKPMVSVALMTLYEEGKFQLTDPLEKFIPGFKDVKVFVRMDENGKMIVEEPRRKPTVQDVLRHTPGLASGLGRGPVNERYRELGLLMQQIQSVRQAVEAMATVPLDYHPGERWVYGLAHDVQAYLVEYFSGVPLDRYLKERLFDPLEMTDTVYGVPKDRAARFVNTYGPGKDGALEVREAAPTGSYARFEKVPLGTLGLSATTMDVARFAQMLLNKGELDGVRVLGKKTVELMTQNHLPQNIPSIGVTASPATGYGLGMSVGSSAAQDANLSSPGIFGWTGAATTRFFVDPVEGLVGVIHAQQMPSDGRLLREFQTMVYQAIER